MHLLDWCRIHKTNNKTHKSNENTPNILKQLLYIITIMPCRYACRRIWSLLYCWPTVTASERPNSSLRFASMDVLLALALLGSRFYLFKCCENDHRFGERWCYAGFCVVRVLHFDAIYHPGSLASPAHHLPWTLGRVRWSRGAYRAGKCTSEARVW